MGIVQGFLDGDEANVLLRSVAEQLKVPLTVIARQAELSEFANSRIDAASIRLQTETALTLVDAYLLGLQLASGQMSLELEPVSIGSLLVETIHELSAFAKHYGVLMELHVGGRYEPVMANRRAFKFALMSLGYALIESEPAQAGSRRLRLAAHRSPHGISAGIYGEYEKLNTDAWRTALELCGRARQPLTALTNSSGAGIFVANTLARAMNSNLRVARRGKESGFAVTLLPSQQMQLV